MRFSYITRIPLEEDETMEKRRFSKVGWSFLVVLCLAFVVSGFAVTTAVAEEKEEEYVWISALSSFPMFVINDHVGLKQFGEEYGVKVTVAGPVEYDIAGQARTIEEVAARKPAGIMVLGLEPALKGAIDKAVDMGVPVVCIDADVKESKRFAFIGTDWYQVGITHARLMAEHTGGKGKVAAVVLIGPEIYVDCLRGYRETIAKYPDMEYVGEFQSEGNPEVAARVTADILSANPDIAGISGFDGATPGIGAALKEAGMGGKVIVTGMNVDPPQIKYLEDGVFHALVGQKRALFTYYGGKLLYDYNHSKVTITPNDPGVGLTNIPARVDTGLFVIDNNNVKAFKGEQ
jgi:ABC-type sugar transport system substrate-binding protein